MPKTTPTRRPRKATPAADRLRARLSAWVGGWADRTHSLVRHASSRAAGVWPLSRARVEILCTNAGRRARLARAIRRALRQLRRSVPDAPRLSAIVVSEHVTASGRHLAGSAYVRPDRGGTHRALLRLALVVDGRALSDDEVLAVLAEQWIGLAVEQGSPCVLIPTELPPGAGAANGCVDGTAVHGATKSDWRSDDDPLASFLRTTPSAHDGRVNGHNRRRLTDGAAA